MAVTENVPVLMIDTAFGGGPTEGIFIAVRFVKSNLGDRHAYNLDSSVKRI